MRTKTLLLTAAIVVAGIGASQAQVYSVNAVGYVNVTIRNGYNLIANPLNGTNNNNINAVIPIAPSGSSVFKWDSVNQTFAQADSYIDGFGWADGNFELSSTVLKPGQAFFFQNPGATATLTFVGDVPQGSLTNAVNANYGFYSSIVPQGANLTTLGFPAQEGMIYNGWDAINQTYAQGYSYFGGAWYNNAFETVDPSPAVAEGFLILNTGAPVNWIKNFSVN